MEGPSSRSRGVGGVPGPVALKIPHAPGI